MNTFQSKTGTNLVPLRAALERPLKALELMWLSVIAYTSGDLWRRLALPRKMRNWSLTNLPQRSAKTRGRLVKHARYYWLL